MAVTIDSTNVKSGQTQFGTTLTVSSCVVASGDNRIVVPVGARMSTSPGPSGITWNGNALSFIGHMTYGSTLDDISWWYLDNPTPGTGNLVITTATSITAIGGAFIPLIGVDTSVAPVLGTGSTATSTSPACSLTGAGSSDLQLATLFVETGSITFPGGNQSNITSQAPINTNWAFSADDITGAFAGNFTWTITSAVWGAMGITVFAPSSASSAPIAWLHA